MNHKPIIPWIGGKRRLAKNILPLFPPHTCYVEPFCGGAALFFLKDISRAEVLNDVNGEVVNLYRVVKHHLEEFCRQFKHALVSRQLFEWLKVTPTETLTDIQRAARFFYLQKMAFGAKVSSQTFGVSASGPPRLNLLRIEEDLSQAHLRLSRTTIEHLDWMLCMTRYDRPGTLFFCDPPYWQTEGYGVGFGMDQYEALAKLMRSMQGKTIVTVNDHSAMKAVFAEFTMQTVEINYTVGGAGKGGGQKELIIRNF